MDFAILATFGAIAAGNYLAWSNINYKKFFDLFRPAASGQEVVNPAEIKIKKDRDNGVILEFTGIPIVDLVTPEQLAEAEQQIAEATSEKPAEKKAEKQQAEEAAIQPKAQLYNIKINTKKKAEDITLAEIYLSNWEETFEVTITTSEGKAVRLSSDEYNKVVASLKTLLPSTSPSKEITQDPLISTVEADGGTIAFDNGKDPQFLEHNKEFNRALLRAAVEKAKKRDPSFLNGYFEALEQGNRNGLFNAEKKHLELLEKKKKLEEAQGGIRAKVIKRWTIATISAISAVLVVAGLVTAAVFFPPIVAAIPAAIPIILKVSGVVSALIDPAAAIAAGRLPEAVVLAGTITSALGFGRKLWRYLRGYNEKAEIKKGLEEVEKELKETEEVEKILREGVHKKMGKEGVEEVLKVIDPNIQKKPGVLKLRDIGPAGLQVLCDHLQSNGIPRYQKIDLTGTLIDSEGAKSVLEALSENFTVTELTKAQLSYSKQVEQETKDGIAAQLLINGYLQGAVSDNDPRIAELFGNAQVFKNAVIIKIKDKNTYEKITSFAEALESLNPTEGKSPKEGVAKRVRELCKLSYTSTSASLEFKAFKENLRKAALVSMVTGTFGDLEYDYKGTYEELRSEFKKQSARLKQAGKTEDAEKLDKMLKEDFEEDLKTRYSCLSQANANLAVDTQNIEKLKQELKSNHDLQSFEFVGARANLDAKAAVEFVCHRNLLIEALEKSDLKSFIENYSLIPADRCEEALEEIGKLGALKLITEQDFKDNNYSQVWAEVTLSSSCGKWLRDLDPEHREKLLKHSFSLNETPAAAKEKARVVSALLKIDGLFLEPDDDTKKDIKRQIYWAITPLGGRGSARAGQPYYNLEELRNNLREKVPEGNSYRKVLDDIFTPTAAQKVDVRHEIPKMEHGAGPLQL